MAVKTFLEVFHCLLPDVGVKAAGESATSDYQDDEHGQGRNSDPGYPFCSTAHGSDEAGGYPMRVFILIFVVGPTRAGKETTVYP